MKNLAELTKFRLKMSDSTDSNSIERMFGKIKRPEDLETAKF